MSSRSYFFCVAYNSSYDRKQNKTQNLESKNSALHVKKFINKG